MTNFPAQIALDGLEKRFAGQEKPALASLTAEIHSGAVTGLVGTTVRVKPLCCACWPDY